MSARFDLASLAAGIAVLVLGGLLLLDQGDSLELSLGLVGALLAAVLGIVLLVSGLTDAEPPEPPARAPTPEPPEPPARTPTGADEG